MKDANNPEGQMHKPILLMTRPAEASERFVADLPQELREGLDIVVAPLMEIVHLLPVGTMPEVQGVIFTSANGVKAAETLFSSKIKACVLAHCVGAHTASVARQSGWRLGCQGANADALVADLLRARPPAPLVHLRGEHARGDVAARLRADGLVCTDLPVYAQNLRPLSPDAGRALASDRSVIVPLFSPRSARHFAHYCADAKNLHLIAISDVTAHPLECLNYNSLRVSSAPDAAAMMLVLRDAAVQLAAVERGERGQ